MFDEGWPDQQGRQRPTAWWLDPDESYYSYYNDDGWNWEHDNDKSRAYLHEDPHDWYHDYGSGLGTTSGPRTTAPPEELPEVPADEDEKALLEEEAEAFAIVEEAQKTLRQARDAVQKTRQTIGYFPLGGRALRHHLRQADQVEKGLAQPKEQGLQARDRGHGG